MPTVLPKGIVQTAVLKRGNNNDLLIFNNNEEFLAQKDGVIATGSLRRKAQWLNRYPTHTVVNLRGNINTRLEKLSNNDWDGGYFCFRWIGANQQKARELCSAKLDGSSTSSRSYYDCRP